MKTFPVHSTKYDGSLHYRYATTFVREDSGVLMLYAGPGEPVDCYRGQMTTRYHSLGLFWSDRCYNLEVTWTADWQPLMHYVNVSTPATWHDGTLRFVDLDLDVIWRAISGEVILDDEDEFELHQARFAYPPDLVAQAWQSVADVRALIAERVYPFDGSLHAWRPDAAA
jgi:protein associated with RNAse G/E